MELCGEWTAIHDHMPGEPKTLRVAGQVCCQSGGWRADLTKSEPQGINQRVLLLDLAAIQDGEVQTDVQTTVDVEYSEATDAEYDEVTVHVKGTPEGEPVADKTVPVQIVH